MWPALHNLPEYIASDYDDPRVLREHWSSYVRVNYQFAIDSVRNSRPQDFIWIHGNLEFAIGLFLCVNFRLSVDKDIRITIV